MIDKDKLRADLIRDEGMVLKPYTDTVGKTTIGVGRNLTDVGLTEAEALMLLDHDIDAVMARLDNRLSWWRTLDEPRQRVLANMAFNMGVDGLLTFKGTLAFVQSGQYAAAASGMRHSLWATQVGRRAERLAKVMETGVD